MVLDGDVEVLSWTLSTSIQDSLREHHRYWPLNFYDLATTVDAYGNTRLTPRQGQLYSLALRAKTATAQAIQSKILIAKNRLINLPTGI